MISRSLGRLTLKRLNSLAYHLGSVRQKDLSRLAISKGGVHK
jgi:hypothetical protein